MAVGIIIHVSIGKEKRSEFFREENIRIGSTEACELQIHTSKLKKEGVWLEIELEDGVYRILNFDEDLGFKVNDAKLNRYVEIGDGDIFSIDSTEISFSFFHLSTESSLITTNRDSQVAQFIEEAAIGAASTEKRDDAKAFLREFSRELLKEISWSSKAIAIVLIGGLLSGLFYLGYGLYRDSVINGQLVKEQNATIKKLNEAVKGTNARLEELDKSNKEVQEIVSLAPKLRVEYGNGICLIVGIYDLVERKTGKTLRYPDPNANKPDPYEPPPQNGENLYEPSVQTGLTTGGNGSPVEYDFIGTGFHVGGGYIVTNRHVLQPWSEDDLVKQLMRESNGRARIKRLVIYFPNYTKPFPLKIRKKSFQQDVAIASFDPELATSDIPALPLAIGNESVAVGETVVTMGYPNGPDRLLAMADNKEAKRINEMYGRSRQALINYLAQTKKIVPLLTQGAITDLDSKRVVHDAKTAEGGSGAPLFGQSGKVIGVNFGIFTQNNASNMAVPIRYAVGLLKDAGWQIPDNVTNETTDTTSKPTNSPTTAQN